jgi:hypothetical protein
MGGGGILIKFVFCDNLAPLLCYGQEACALQTTIVSIENCTGKKRENYNEFNEVSA